MALSPPARALLLPDWVDLKFKAQDFPVGKTAKPFELASRTIMVYKFDGMVFASDAASTAYQYPMTDAQLSKDAQTGRVIAEVPLVSCDRTREYSMS